MKCIASLFFFAVIVTFSYGQPRYPEQNLVPNSSFERNNGCPQRLEDIGMVVFWYRSTVYSADYFHRCAKPFQRMNFGIPNNMFGYQEARSGDAYAGLSYCNEALSVRLTRPMVKDSIYKVEFFVNLADSSDVGTRYFGMYISQREVPFISDNRGLISRFVLEHPPQIQNPRDRYLTDKENWTSINGIYIAKGGEQFIAIGGFYQYHDSIVQTVKPDRTLKSNYRSWEKHLGYYYVDDVSIVPYSMNWQTDISYLLKYVYFDFDEIELVSESVDELTRLSEHLKKHPTYNISIRGHTDSFGTEEYNQNLAVNRAAAVVEWLVKFGDINRNRIKYSGSGSMEPIADNNTEYGRSINRRVEFVLTDENQVLMNKSRQ